MESVAQQIAAATGPSGPNHEYLERLAEALWKACILCFRQGSCLNTVGINVLALSPCQLCFTCSSAYACYSALFWAGWLLYAFMQLVHISSVLSCPCIAHSAAATHFDAEADGVTLIVQPHAGQGERARAL